MTRYRFILAEEANHAISTMCRVLKVSRSGYYDWRRHRSSRPAHRSARFDAHVRAAFERSRGRYGSRRLQAELNANGIACSRTRVAASMRRNGLVARGRRRFKATTDSKHTRPVAPNRLERNFQPDGPNEAWVSDITYVWTTAGWLYLAVIIDLWSRRVVGYATSRFIDRKLVLDALAMAVGVRGSNPGLIAHSDRGSQYASRDYQAALDAAGMVCSMSRKGDCWDNAPAESLFATIKNECLHGQTFASRDEAHATIVAYILWYNAERRHSTLGLISPAEFEATFITHTMAA